MQLKKLVKKYAEDVLDQRPTQAGQASVVHTDLWANGCVENTGCAGETEPCNAILIAAFVVGFRLHQIDANAVIFGRVAQPVRPHQTLIRILHKGRQL